MASAIFRHGDPIMADYTPQADTPAGSVIPIGDGLTCGVTHVDIKAGEKGAYAVGGGVYELTNLDGTGLGNGDTVHFDAGDDGVTGTATDNLLFGFVVRDGGGAAGSKCFVLHHPYVQAATGGAG